MGRPELVFYIRSSGRIAAIDAKNTMILMTGQSAACADVHPVVFTSFRVLIAPGMVDANIYTPRQIPRIPPMPREKPIFCKSTPTHFYKTPNYKNVWIFGNGHLFGV